MSSIIFFSQYLGVRNLVAVLPTAYSIYINPCCLSLPLEIFFTKWNWYCPKTASEAMSSFSQSCFTIILLCECTIWYFIKGSNQSSVLRQNDNNVLNVGVITWPSTWSVVQSIMNSYPPPPCTNMYGFHVI